MSPFSMATWMRWQNNTIAPFTLAIRTRFESSNYNEPASVVAILFTLQGSRGGLTAVCLSFIILVALFCLHVRKILRAQPKVVEADLIRQKFQMWFKLPNRNRVANDNVTITNCSQIAIESRSNRAVWTGLIWWNSACT